MEHSREIELGRDQRNRVSGTHRGLGKVKATLQPMSWFRPEERAKALKEPEAKRLLMPRPTPRYVLKELLGWNSINDKFLYVSDGGHYENLGLVELLRRGCARIYCFDASGGKALGALGDAIALARSELGVEITFADEELDKLREGENGFAMQRCATGAVRFTRSTTGFTKSTAEVTGRIVYAPTVMTSDLPWDVHAFKQEDPSLPPPLHTQSALHGPEVRDVSRARLLRGRERNEGHGRQRPLEERQLVEWVVHHRD